jgi:hypothetical protein
MTNTNKTGSNITNHCRECGAAVEEFCAEHPKSIVDSILSQPTVTIADVVRSLGPYATVDNLKSAGFSRRAIEAAVRRDVLSWTRDGNLELGGQVVKLTGETITDAQIHDHLDVVTKHETCGQTWEAAACYCALGMDETDGSYHDIRRARARARVADLINARNEGKS